MKLVRIALALAFAALLMVPGGLLAQPASTLKATLTGFEEVPALSNTGTGQFRVKIGDGLLEFELSYAGLTGVPLAAHIHLGQRGVNGGVIAFLCGGGGKPACPAPPASITGTIVAADVIGPAGQGIAAGEFAEAVAAILARVTYANVHTATFPGGEIRGQIE